MGYGEMFRDLKEGNRVRISFEAELVYGSGATVGYIDNGGDELTLYPWDLDNFSIEKVAPIIKEEFGSVLDVTFSQAGLTARVVYDGEYWNGDSAVKYDDEGDGHVVTPSFRVTYTTDALQEADSVVVVREGI